MVSARKRLILVSVVGAVLALALIGVAITSTQTSIPGSQTDHSTSGSRTELPTLSTTTLFGLVPCPGNCTIAFPWPKYQTLAELKAVTSYVVVANVTTSSTFLIDGIPVTFYNVTVIATLQYRGASLPPGYVLSVAQLGGSTNGTTMQIKGYPPLNIRHTYVLFLSVPGSTLTNYYTHPNNRFVSMVAMAGPHGTFSVEDGKVYSFDKTFPRDDAWLPVKVPGVPLAEFISQVQAPSATTSSV